MISSRLFLIPKECHLGWNSFREVLIPQPSHRIDSRLPQQKSVLRGPGTFMLPLATIVYSAKAFMKPSNTRRQWGLLYQTQQNFHIQMSPGSLALAFHYPASSREKEVSARAHTDLCYPPLVPSSPKKPVLNSYSRWPARRKDRWRESIRVTGQGTQDWKRRVLQTDHLYWYIRDAESQIFVNLWVLCCSQMCHDWAAREREEDTFECRGVQYYSSVIFWRVGNTWHMFCITLSFVLSRWSASHCWNPSRLELWTWTLRPRLLWWVEDQNHHYRLIIK